jgi:hypothetical protein
MAKKKHVILGVHITDRVHHVKKVQEMFTKFGCSIKTRLGLHEASDELCSPNGLVVLEMVGDEKEINKLATGLGKIAGVEVKKMVFDHD